MLIKSLSSRWLQLHHELWLPESWRVPKRDLVGVLQVLLQTERLKAAAKLKLGSVLSQEMLNFRVKIDPSTAQDFYSAWREQEHDDLVLSVALACWAGERFSASLAWLEFFTGPLEAVFSEESDTDDFREPTIDAF